MSSPFFGMDIALRGLFAAQTAMNVVAHNVSNANTDGYSRQIINTSASEPFTNPSFYKPLATGQMGTGAEVISITRMRDSSIELQIRNNVQLVNEYEAKAEVFSMIEAIFNEPGSMGLNSLIDDFFNQFNELSSSPESSVIRAQVRQSAETLTGYFNKLYGDLTGLSEDIDDNIRITVSGINSLLNQISDVNQLITGIISTGDDPNDLLDKRDYLLGQLSEYVEIDIAEQSDRAVNVYIGGQLVVQRGIVQELAVVDDTSNYNYAAVRMADDLNGKDVSVSGGELKGLIDARDSSDFGVRNYIDSLDALAYNLTEEVNTQHRAGFGLDGIGNRNFFTPISQQDASGNISLSANILDPVNGLSRIAAASAAASVPGDGSNALLITQLQNDVSAIENATFNEYYIALISQLGVYADIESNKVENQDFLINQLYNMRDDVSGVSLDEEAAKLIAYQNAYNAATQVIQVMDENYKMLIDMMN